MADEKYVKQENGDYHCRVCNSVIMAVSQRRSVWTLPEFCAGSGEVRTVQVPYCPTCEPVPAADGPPITA